MFESTNIKQHRIYKRREKIRTIIITLQMIFRKLFTHINHEDMEQYDKEVEATAIHAM